MDNKILVFGSKVHGNISPADISLPGYQIDFHRFPGSDWERLSDYSIIIVDYDAFNINGNFYSNDLERFEPQLYQALKNGAYICFLHYDEQVPKFDKYNFNQGYMDSVDVEELDRKQIGYKFLNLRDIKPSHTRSVNFIGEIKRPEFKNFLDSWGTSKNYFEVFNNGKIDESIYSLEKYNLAFSLRFQSGKVIFLPCQRNTSNKEDTKKMLASLIAGLVTYKTKSRTVLPGWFNDAFFDEESQIVSDIKKLDEEKQLLEAKRSVFSSAKSLMFYSEHELEEELPQFIEMQLGIKTRKQERYNEDFWILDNEENKIGICEIKSTVNGFKKTFIYKTFDHRESADLDETFPAILFVSFNLNATSWNEKNKPIPKQECKIAFENNVLVIRIEDLVFLWQAFKNNLIKVEDIKKILISNSGWLNFKENGIYIIEKGN